MKHINTKSIDETVRLGREFAATLKGGEAVCLYGDLGAGKTVFVKGVIDYFIPGKRVLSPTFIIVRHYPTNNKTIKEIIHVDLYRLDTQKDIVSIGLRQFLHKPDSVVLIEWAQKLGVYLPQKRIDVKISHLGETVRSFELKRYG